VNTGELGLSLSGDSLSCSGVWRCLALRPQDHSDEGGDGDDDKLEVRAKVSQLQLICWEGEQHWGLTCTPV